jgi:hypothetical protein
MNSFFSTTATSKFNDVVSETSYKSGPFVSTESSHIEHAADSCRLEELRVQDEQKTIQLISCQDISDYHTTEPEIKESADRTTVVQEHD